MNAVLEAPVRIPTATARRASAVTAAVAADDLAALAASTDLGSYRRTFRSPSNSVECCHAANLVMVAVLACGTPALSRPGSIEVPLGIPLCDRVSTEIHRANQASGTMLEQLRFKEIEAGNIKVSWNGRGSSAYLL